MIYGPPTHPYEFNSSTHTHLSRARATLVPKIKNLSEINDKIASVQNFELKKSLKNFLKAFDEKNK